MLRSEATYSDDTCEWYVDNYFGTNDMVVCADTGDLLRESSTYICAWNGRVYGDDTSHVRIGHDTICYRNMSAYFERNRDAFVDWWNDGQKRHDDDDIIDTDDYAEEFCNAVDEGAVTLDTAAYEEAYRDCCITLGREPVALKEDDEDEEDDTPVNRDATPLE